MSLKSDWELLPIYYDGENEPVGIWIERNFNSLLLYGYHVTKEKETIKDAIQDVADKLCSLKKIIRPVKFKPINKNIQGALWIRLKNRLIDIIRANQRRKEVLQEVRKTNLVSEPEDKDQEIFEMRINQIKKYQAQLPLKEQQFLELVMKFKKLKPIMKELGIDEKEARTIKQRIVRKIKRELLTESKKQKNG